MKTTNSITIKTENGSTLQVPLEKCGERDAATIFVDGVPYHLERMSKELLCENYKIDTDPGYIPKTDKSKRCVIISPYSQR